MKFLIKNILYITVLFVMFACTNHGNNTSVTLTQNVDNKSISDSLEKLNRYLLQQESQMIDDYVIKNNLKVIKTGTGLRYEIIEEGEGELVKKGDIVTLEYSLESLTGDLFYSSENDGNKTFVVGRGGVESGLEEAVLKLRTNSEAILILPAHLAHGLAGDGNKIKYRATLVYKVKVVEKHR